MAPDEIEKEWAGYWEINKPVNKDLTFSLKGPISNEPYVFLHYNGTGRRTDNRSVSKMKDKE